MTSRIVSLKIFLGILVSFLFTLTARADSASEITSAYNKVAAFYVRGDNPSGLELAKFTIDKHEATALEDFGPAFGQFYYMKGLFLVRMREYVEAAEAFQTCREKFPNTGSDRGRVNEHFTHALVQRAGCLMIQDQFDDAAQAYQAALSEVTVGSPVNATHIGVNLARCHLKLGEGKGKEMLFRALDSSKLTDNQKYEIFAVLVEDWAAAASDAEVHAFLQKYGALVGQAKAEDRRRLSPRFLRAANLALSKGEPVRALTWYSLTANPSDQIVDLERRIATEAADTPNPAILEQIDKLKQENAVALAGVAAAHVQMRNYRAAATLYGHLAQNFPAHQERPVILHNGVACMAQIGDLEGADVLADLFFSEYSDHELAGDVARVYSESVFLSGNYDASLVVASERRTTMPEGSAPRDVLDFVAGASLYHLQKYEEAEAELAAYRKHYPKGRRLDAVLYYHGATLVQVRRWEDAIDAFYALRQRAPDSPLVPSGLYLSAHCHLQIDMLDEGLEQVEHLLKRHPDSAEAAAAISLKGDLLSSIGDTPPEEILPLYAKSHTLAAALNESQDTASYALWQMMSVSTVMKDWDGVGSAYDTFQEGYSDSIFRAEAAVASLDGLAELERQGNAVDNIQGLLREFGEDKNSPELTELFGSYAGYLQERFGEVGAIEELHRWEEREELPEALLAWLIMAEIDIMETSAREHPQKAINSLYYRIKLDLDQDNISNYCLLKMARWSTEQRNKPEEAEEIYRYIIESREGAPGFEFALYDIGLLEAYSDDPAIRELALLKLQRVLDDFDNPELVEPATLELARLHTREGRNTEAKQWWNAYLKDRTWSSGRAEGNYQLADLLLQEGKRAEALKLFVSVYVNFPGQLDWSTRAYLDAAKILHGDGKDEKALRVLRDMIVRMQSLKHPSVDEAHDLFTKWRTAYELKLKNQG